MAIAGYTLGAPWLALAAGVTVAVAFLVVRVKFGAPPLPRLRRVVANLGIVLALITAALTAGDVRQSHVVDRRAVLLLIDASASATPASADEATRAWRALKQSLGPRDALGAAAYGSSITVLAPFAPPTDQPEVLPWTVPLEGFNLESRLDGAIRTAQLLFPEGHIRQLIIVSDGAGTSAISALPPATAILRVPPQEVRDVALTSLHLSGGTGTGDAAPGATVEVVLHASHESKANVRVTSAIGAIGDPSTREVTLYPGLTPHAVTLPTLPDPGTSLSADAASQDDSLPGNETLKLSVPRLGRPPSVALVDGSANMTGTNALMAALLAGGIDVSRMTPENVPTSAGSLDMFDALIITDTPASRLSTDAQSALEAWALAGGGLAMLGSPESFAPGGWHDTPVERALPVTSRVERDPTKTVAVCIVLDVSGSMSAPSNSTGRRTKMDEANRGADLSMRLAMDGDGFGVLATDTRNRWVLPLAKLDNREQARKKVLSNQTGGGGIDLKTALNEALPALHRSDAKRKFLIIFADGGDVDMKDGCLGMVRAARATHGIEVSTIAVGEGDDVDFLRDLAREGGGQMLLTTNADRLPVLFSSEVARFTGGHLDERPIAPDVKVKGELTDGIGFPNSPNLEGMVLTTLRPNATMWLQPSGGEHPLLATWRVGLGRGMVFASDARDRWADKWLGWEGYAQCWQRWVRWLAAGGGYSGAADADVRFENDSIHIDLVHRSQAQGTVICQVWYPDGSIRRIPMDRLSSQRAVASLPARPAGTYRLDFWFEPSSGADAIPLGMLTASRVPYSESDMRQTDPEALTLLAVASGGGRVLSARDALNFAPPPMDEGRPAHLPAAIGAILTLLALLASRRFPRLFGRDTEVELAGVDRVLSVWAEQRRVLASGGRAAARTAPRKELFDVEGESASTEEGLSSVEEPRPSGETTSPQGSTNLGKLVEARRQRQKDE